MPLTSIARIKEACSVPVTTTRFDDILTLLADVAELKIQQRYHLPFGQTSYLEKYYDVDSQATLTLQNTPIVSVQQITVFDYPPEVGGTPIVLSQNLTAPSQYIIEDPTNGIIKFDVSSPYIPPGLEVAISVMPFFWAEVDIQYTAGILPAGQAELPEDIQLATCWVVQHWFDMNGRNLDVRSIRTGDLTMQAFDDLGWPVRVSELLAWYQPPEVGVV